jgi:Tetratricopeptide repeat
VSSARNSLDDRPTCGGPTTDARWRRLAWLYGGPLIVALWIAAGCRPQGSSSPPSRLADSSNAGSTSEVLYYAIGVLRGMDDTSRSDTLNSVVARLNQWIASQPALPDWKPDPLVATLPAELRQLATLKTLGDLEFLPTDGTALRQIIWLREVSEHAAGPESDALARATRLFDWTVRNIQLEASGTAAVPHVPADILLLGRGEANDRAWVFMLLARQQGLDVVMLARPGSDPAKVVDLLPALLQDGKLYLFDPTLGMPVPGPGGSGVATLGEVAGDDGLLRRLDLDAGHPYPLKSADFQQVVALVEASPIYLSQRARLVESALAGKQQLALSVQPSKLAERLKTVAHVQDVGLWPLPYERFRQRAEPDEDGRLLQAAAKEMRPFLVGAPPFPIDAAILLKARVLHLLGKYTGTEGAIAMYQHARPSQRQLQAILDDKRVQKQRAQLAGVVDLMKRSKEDASYWLGLVAFERGDYDTAIDYFQKRTLDASPTGPWTAGARYNLGRTYEAQGKTAEAVGQYEAGQSPQRHGNLLRARWLKDPARPKP